MRESGQEIVYKQGNWNRRLVRPSLSHSLDSWLLFYGPTEVMNLRQGKLLETISSAVLSR